MVSQACFAGLPRESYDTMGIKLVSRNLDFRSMAKDLGQRIVLIFLEFQSQKEAYLPKQIDNADATAIRRASTLLTIHWGLLKALRVYGHVCNLIPDQSGDFETTQVSDMKASDSTWNQGHEMQVHCKSLRRAVKGIIVTIYIFLNVVSQQTFHKIHDCD